MNVFKKSVIAIAISVSAMSAFAVDGFQPVPDLDFGGRPEINRPDVTIGGLGDTTVPNIPNGGGAERPEVGEGETPVTPERPEALPEVDEDFTHNGSDIERPQPNLSGAIGDINNNINNMNSALNGRIDAVEQDIEALNGGVAMSFAMSAIPQAYRPHTTNVGVAGGYYNGANAVAIGVSHNFEAMSVNLKASTTGEDTGFAVGVGYSF